MTDFSLLLIDRSRLVSQSCVSGGNVGMMAMFVAARPTQTASLLGLDVLDYVSLSFASPSNL